MLRHIASQRVLSQLINPAMERTAYMRCKLAETPNKTLLGRTFLTVSTDGEMLPAAVYMPPNHNKDSRTLNVVLYLHGWYVGSKEALINTDKSRICDQVMNSGKDVVLVAPWLGNVSGPDNANALQTGRFGQAGYGHRFLRAILDALAPASLAAFVAGRATPVVAATNTIRGADAISGAGPIVPAPFGIKNLIIACHSGGGVAMRNVVQTLGPFESNLRECIGLDCLYDGGNLEKKREEDAKFWFDRAKKPGAPPAYFVFGPSTRRQSIKLYLMAKGRIDALGNPRNPAGPALANLTVWPGHISHVMYGGVVTNVTSSIDGVMDDSITKTPTAPPTGKAAPGKSAVTKNFVEQAIDNFDGNYIFPSFLLGGEMGIHYFIARDFLRERLKSVALA